MVMESFISLSDIMYVFAVAKENALELTIGAALSILALRLTIDVIGRSYYAFFPLPKTQFGFRGKLVYVDDSPSTRVLVTHRYQIGAKPDFVFKTGWKRYADVEYKSRKAPVKHSDICQAYASVLAARSRWNVTDAYIVTGVETRHLECGSSRAIYRKIAKHHQTAKKVKHLNKPQPIKPIEKCGGCGFKHHCHSQH